VGGTRAGHPQGSWAKGGSGKGKFIIYDSKRERFAGLGFILYPIVEKNPKGGGEISGINPGGKGKFLDERGKRGVGTWGAGYFQKRRGKKVERFPWNIRNPIWFPY